MADPKRIPLFITDVPPMADSDIDEWAQHMAEHVSRVTRLPLEDKPAQGTSKYEADQSAEQSGPLTGDQMGK